MMNKPLRFLIVILVLLITILTTFWKISAQSCPGGKCEKGIQAGESVSTFGSRGHTLEVLQDQSPLQRGLTLLEFFAGY